MEELISPVVISLMKAFPNSFINYLGEFIADRDTNQWFQLNDCRSELDVKCKVLERLSRAACKTEAFRSTKKNQEFHIKMLNSINVFLETSFTQEQMMEIYTYLGNSCNHEKTMRFVNGGYDMSVLEESKCQKTDTCKYYKSS